MAKGGDGEADKKRKDRSPQAKNADDDIAVDNIAVDDLTAILDDLTSPSSPKRRSLRSASLADCGEQLDFTADEGNINTTRRTSLSKRSNHPASAMGTSPPQDLRRRGMSQPNEDIKDVNLAEAIGDANNKPAAENIKTKNTFKTSPSAGPAYGVDSTELNLDLKSPPGYLNAIGSPPVASAGANDGVEGTAALADAESPDEEHYTDSYHVKLFTGGYHEDISLKMEHHFMIFLLCTDTLFSHNSTAITLIILAPYPKETGAPPPQ